MGRIRPAFLVVRELPVPEIRNFTVKTAPTALGSDGFGFSVQQPPGSVVQFKHVFSIPTPPSLDELLDTTGFDQDYWNITALNYFGVLQWSRGPGIQIAKVVIGDDGDIALTTIGDYLESVDFSVNGIINFGIGLQQYGEPLDVLILRRGFDNSGSPFAYCGATSVLVSLDYSTDPSALIKDLPPCTIEAQHFATGIKQCVLHLENLVNSTCRLSFKPNPPTISYFGFDTTGWAKGLENDSDFWDPANGCGILVLDWDDNQLARFSWAEDFNEGDVIDLTSIVLDLSGGQTSGIKILRYRADNVIACDDPAFGLCEIEAFAGPDLDPENQTFFGIQPLLVGDSQVSRPCGFAFAIMPPLMRFVLGNRYAWSGGRYVEPE